MNKRSSSRVACCGVAMLLTLVLLAILVLPSAPPAAAAAGSSYLASGERLFRDTALVSPNGRYVLAMQSDGNLVVYGPGNVPLWASNTSGRPEAFVVNQGDGNLVVYSGAGAPLWHSATYGRGASTLRMQDDGNLVLYKDGGGPTWASGTVQAAPPPPASTTDRLSAGQRLNGGQSLISPNGAYRLDMQTDGNLVIYGPGQTPLWSTKTYGRPGAFVVNQGDGNLVVYSGAGAPLWHSATYGRGASTLRMQDDGNLVLYKDGGGPTWASGTVQAAPPSAIPTSPNTAAFAAQVLDLLNARRQQYGCPPVVSNQLLRNAAQRYAVDMATYRYLSHTGRDGSTFGDRVAREGYRFASLGEILAQGQTTPESVVVAWMGSPVHRDIILTCGYREIGIGYSDNGHYWVAEFGSP